MKENNSFIKTIQAWEDYQKNKNTKTLAKSAEDFGIPVHYLIKLNEIITREINEEKEQFAFEAECLQKRQDVQLAQSITHIEKVKECLIEFKDKKKKEVIVKVVLGNKKTMGFK